MKIRNRGFALLLILPILFSCSRQAKTEPTITATIYPYYLVADAIAGDFFEINLLIPQGSSPHTYSPKPSDLANLHNASLIIANGFALEGKALDKIRTYKTALDMEDYIHPEKMDDRYSSINPHIWLDAEMLDSMIILICNSIVEIMPENEDIFRTRTDDLRNALHVTDSIIMSEAGDIGNIEIITFHEAFHYFAERYGINIAAAIEPVPGKDPTLKELAVIKGIIEKYSIKAIYTEPQLNPKGAQIIAEENNIGIYVLDPLGSSSDVSDISALYMFNWEQIKKGLNID